MKHHYPNCDLGDRCNCQEIDDIEQEQITTMNNDTPRTNDIIEQIKGFRTSSAIYSLEQFSRLLERELTAVTEQRDRLLEQQEQWRLSSVCRELTAQRDRLAEALLELRDNESLSLGGAAYKIVEQALQYEMVEQSLQSLTTN